MVSVGYYRKFVHNYGTIVAPLMALLKEGFAWSDEATTTFSALKGAMMFAPVLTLPDFTKPFVIECDASTYGFGPYSSRRLIRSPSSADRWRPTIAL
jgi:hypothetical protein